MPIGWHHQRSAKQPSVVKIVPRIEPVAAKCGTHKTVDKTPTPRQVKPAMSKAA